jgi:hypothetical protein
MPEYALASIKEELHNLKEDYELCDRENTNLRKHLLWCASFLNNEQRKELAQKISKTVKDGGVTEDLKEDTFMQNVNLIAAINVLCDETENFCEGKQVVPARVLEMVRTVRDLMPDKIGKISSLAEIRIS